MRIRTGNFKSNDVAEMIVVGGTNVSVSGVENASGDAVITVSASPGGGGTGLVVVPTAIKNANYTAVAADYVPVSTAFNAVTVTLPLAPADGSVVGVKLITQAAANAVTVTVGGGSDVFNTVLGPTSISLTLLNQDVIVQYDAALAIWFAIVDDYTIPAIDTLSAATDNTNLNATSSKHGLLPKLSNVITQFFNGQGGYSTPVLDQLGAPSDITTLNATTSAHGLLKKLSGVATQYLDGTGGFSTPPGSSGTIGQVTSTGGTISITGATGPVVNIEAAASASRNPWSTGLGTSTSIGAATFTVVDALPAAKFIAAGIAQYMVMVVDAWTANAELELCAVDATGKVITPQGTFQHAHSAGCAILLVEDFDIWAEWWGILGNGGTASVNTAALNAMFGQLNNSHSNNPLGYTFNVRVAPGKSMATSAQITVTGGVALVQGLNLICNSDFGSGQAAISFSSAPAGTQILDITVGCSVGAPSYPSFIAGGSVPWVLMDGIRVDHRHLIERCNASNFRAGIYLGFFDHAAMRDCQTNGNYYGVYVQGSTSAGDAAIEKHYASFNYRAAYGFGNGAAQLQGSSFKDCSWTNQPWVFYHEGGATFLDVTFINVNVEFQGNGWGYFPPSTTSTWSGIVFVNPCPNGPGGGTPGGPNDTNLPTGGGLYADTGALVHTSLCKWQINGVNYAFVSPAGKFDCTGGGNDFEMAGIYYPFLSGFSENVSNTWASRITIPCYVGSNHTSPNVSQLAGFFAGLASGGTINAGDLCESFRTSVFNPGVRYVRQYQTSGAPPIGFSFFGSVGTNPLPATAIFNQGFGRINVFTTTATGVNAINSATLNVGSTASFGTTGSFLMQGGTVVTYTGKTSTTFTGCSNHSATTGGELIYLIIPPGVYLKPDLATPGCVIAASSFADGPIVGWTEFGTEYGSISSYGMFSDGSVHTKLMV